MAMQGAAKNTGGWKEPGARTLQRVHSAVVQVTAADDAAVDQVVQLPLRATPAAWGQALAMFPPHCLCQTRLPCF